jgi:hypothetical protein
MSAKANIGIGQRVHMRSLLWVIFRLGHSPFRCRLYPQQQTSSGRPGHVCSGPEGDIARPSGSDLGLTSSA